MKLTHPLTSRHQLPRSTILIIGSGPIVIGQGCEFDYSGSQACKVLRQEGHRVVLVNSNPATIMTDPQMADATYIEPLTLEILELIIKKEHPDALLPTVGGQTALNLAVALAESGLLDECGVRMIGAPLRSIQIAEDRLKFRSSMISAGLPIPEGGVADSLRAAREMIVRIGYPALIRPSYTLGGSGGGIVYDEADLEHLVEHGLRESPVHEVLIEESVLGWKEYELEVMRDSADNFVVVCSIENIDPMGVHTGDSITVAPAQTLTDKEYQSLRDMARTVMTTVGVETGGSNVQFAVNPKNGAVLVIEMNPRVSRSSALASKATGFPIAKIAALLAIGHTLDEIPNDITRVTPASFEPSLDYCVVKIPRWDFEKFAGADHTLGPQMKSVGEVMAIGRTFPEALNKAVRGLDVGMDGFSRGDSTSRPLALCLPTAQRLFDAAEAYHSGSRDTNSDMDFDPWFVQQMSSLLDTETALGDHTLDSLPSELLRRAKRQGFSDRQIARFIIPSPSSHALEGDGSVREKRLSLGIRPVFHRVDTCAAEFIAHTPYLYSTYESQDEADPTDHRKVVVLGGGPNRIGQGIEFDYCCVQACLALRASGFETIMVNCNPETVSTDYDSADRLYFEPLTIEDVLNVLDKEQPEGVVVQFGGQTPINLAARIEASGTPIWGTSPDDIDLAEDRARFGALLRDLAIDHPEWGTATSIEEALAVASRIGYPVLVRPSYVLGGRAMEIAYSSIALERYLDQALQVAPELGSKHMTPLLIDQFIEDAVEVDVDAIADGMQVVIAGIMQHIEEAGVHSGDSACVLPPYKVSQYHLKIIRDYTERLGMAMQVRGLMNVQYAIKDDVVYVLEVNPRASRTVPFVSKATGVPVTEITAQVLAGRSLREIGFTSTPPVDGFFVKEAILPFKKFPGADALLGPEMRSTGEVMGHAADFGHAFAKAQMAAGMPLPTSGSVLLTVNDFDKSAILKIARLLQRLNFKLYATRGTAAWLENDDIDVTIANKVSEGGYHIAKMVANGEIDMIVNTPLGQRAYDDNRAMRLAAIEHDIPLLTTLSAAQAAASGIKALREKSLSVRSLQQHFEHVPSVATARD